MPLFWKRLFCLISSAVFMLVGCADAQPKEIKPPVSDIQVTVLPPTAKSVIGAMFLSAKVPLNVDSSCHGVGTDFLDATLGDYLSGFLAELNDPDGRNSVQVEITPDTLATDVGWFTRVWLGKSQQEEKWSWGIEFFIRAHDGLVIPTSYRCIGAG
ncbi:hypothetical protein AGMMS50243_02240 [Betaproteobacteria bacterium]|nr:hypothetical protein AGMMS50243_02240 [Betaproteobacteria bacterium]